MKDMRQLLLDLCKNLEFVMSMTDKKNHKVQLLSFSLPEQYGTPMIWLGTTKALMEREEETAMLQWVTEILVDGKPLFIQTMSIVENETAETTEESCYKRLLNSVFQQGICRELDRISNL